MMRKLAVLGIAFSLLAACDERQDKPSSCNAESAYSRNESKVTVGNGVWGTVTFTEGDCMPRIGGKSTCKTCPVQRTVRIYNYTTLNDVVDDANPHDSFYTSFNTTLIKEVEADTNGFFQAELPAGTYTVVVIENGKLYANSFNGQAGINPINIGNGKKKLNLSINWKAAY